MSWREPAPDRRAGGGGASPAGAEMRLRVASVRTEAIDIVSLELVDPDGGRLPAATPGSHIHLRLGEDLVRQYSICNGPGDDRAYRIAVKREPASRGGSAAVHALRPGDIVAASRPLNNFEVDWRAERLVLVAGGIGITPLLAMARHALHRGHPFGLHYFARSPEHAAFHGLLREEMPGRVSFHFGVAPERVGQHLRDVIGTGPGNAQLYLCGPRAFMDVARSVSESCPNISAVKWEYFMASDKPPGGDAEGFAVRLAQSGKTFDVPPGKTILEVLRENGVEVEYSCREGMCGMCMTEVLEGEPDHRDDFLDEGVKRDGDLMMICVSRCKGKLLVLNL